MGLWTILVFLFYFCYIPMHHFCKGKNSLSPFHIYIYFGLKKTLYTLGNPIKWAPYISQLNESTTTIWQYLSFFFPWPHCAPCGISGPHPGTELRRWQCKCQILTTRPPRRPCLSLFQKSQAHQASCEMNIHSLSTKIQSNIFLYRITFLYTSGRAFNKCPKMIFLC